eukprot:2347649-Rhodomonas_salina.1
MSSRLGRSAIRFSTPGRQFEAPSAPNSVWEGSAVLLRWRCRCASWSQSNRASSTADRES